MWPPSGSVRVWLYRRPTDMRRSFDGLSTMVKHVLFEDPLSGALFVFCNRRRTQMKCLWFDGDGYAIWSKRLERGQYRVRFDGDAKTCMDVVTLKMLVDGIDLDSVRRFKRFSRVAHDAVVVQ